MDHGKSTFICSLKPGNPFLLLSTLMSRSREAKRALCKHKSPHTVPCCEKHNVSHLTVIRLTVWLSLESQTVWKYVHVKGGQRVVGIACGSWKGLRDNWKLKGEDKGRLPCVTWTVSIPGCSEECFWWAVWHLSWLTLYWRQWLCATHMELYLLLQDSIDTVSTYTLQIESLDNRVRWKLLLPLRYLCSHNLHFVSLYAVTQVQSIKLFTRVTSI